MSRFNQWLPYNVLPCEWGECKALQVRTKLQLRKQSAGELGGVPAVTPSGGAAVGSVNGTGDRASPLATGRVRRVVAGEAMFLIWKWLKNTILSADWCEANQTF